MKQPFSISVDPYVMDDLRHRLINTRWPGQVGNKNWETGANAEYLKELCRYWSTGFNWEKNENYLNSFAHYKAVIEGLGIHFMYEKGKGSHSVPLLLIHGFPDSFVRFLKVIPLLTAADEDGFSFDVIVPSLPGFGFSDIPNEPGMDHRRMAQLFTKLMTEVLGFSRFIVQGGDWGSTIAEQIGIANPQYLTGIHLTDIPWYHLFDIPQEELTEAEKKYVQTGQQWGQTNGAYAMIQSTKPQSLAYGLNDSPAGLAAWIIEKFHGWSDCNGNLETVFTKDELLTNLTIYWATQTINSAMRLYHEAAGAMQEKKEIKKLEVPTGVTQFQKDTIAAPREFADRLFNIQQWNLMPVGGHFAAMEQPKLFAEDVRKFGRLVR